MTTRRDYVIGAGSAGLFAAPATAEEPSWGQGKLVHLLPTVSHDRILIKASFDAPLDGAPRLQAGTVHVRGQKNSPAADFWQFDISGLKPQTPYRLSLTG